MKSIEYILKYYHIKYLLKQDELLAHPPFITIFLEDNDYSVFYFEFVEDKLSCYYPGRYYLKVDLYTFLSEWGQRAAFKIK